MVLFLEQFSFCGRPQVTLRQNAYIKKQLFTPTRNPSPAHTWKLDKWVGTHSRQRKRCTTWGSRDIGYRKCHGVAHQGYKEGSFRRLVEDDESWKCRLKANCESSSLTSRKSKYPGNKEKPHLCIHTCVYICLYARKMLLLNRWSLTDFINISKCLYLWGKKLVTLCSRASPKYSTPFTFEELT